MLDIHMAHVRGAEEVLVLLRDHNVVLERVALKVGQVPPLAERLRALATSRSRRWVRSGEQAVLMLGCTSVEQETRALVQQWLDAMAHGSARLASTQPQRPVPLQNGRRASGGT